MDDWRPVVVSHLAVEDPWWVAYSAALGTWPATPDAKILEWGRLRPDLSFEGIIRKETEDVDWPGVSDLRHRLEATDVVTPARMSLSFLELRPKTVTYRGEQLLPDRDWLSESYAGNVVVVYEPGSVEDLCLLWSLRAAFHSPVGLPLGIPYTADVVRDAGLVAEVGINAPLHRPRFGLTSLSLTVDRLQELAAELGPSWSVVAAEDVLRAGSPVGRRTADVAVFASGRARVPPLSAADADLLNRVPALTNVEVETRLQPLGRPLPRIRTLRGDYPPTGYRHGSSVAEPPRRRGLVELRWPPGWTVLEAAAKDHGLICRPSRAGASAAALLTTIGGETALQAIALPELVALLHRLGERRGISWFRERFRALASNTPGADQEGQLQRLESGLDELRTRPLDEQQVAVTASEVGRLLGRDLGKAWLEWAERATLLVRGVEIVCDHCGARAWRPMAELAPPHVCRGCGRAIQRAFPIDALKFAYRASEPLLNTVEFDSLAHLMVVRWFSDLWRRSFDEPSELYGTYPGVEFLESGRSKVIGEADVALLMTSGEIVPGEVKRRGAGLTEAEVAKLEVLRTRLGASWSFVATLDWASSCPPLWNAVLRSLPDDPRIALSAEHLFSPFVHWTLGTNPFEWQVAAPEEQADMRTTFLRSLPAALDWLGNEDPIPYWEESS
jgi:hypothetical protein